MAHAAQACKARQPHGASGRGCRVEFAQQLRERREVDGLVHEREHRAAVPAHVSASRWGSLTSAPRAAPAAARSERHRQLVAVHAAEHHVRTAEGRSRRPCALGNLQGLLRALGLDARGSRGVSGSDAPHDARLRGPRPAGWSRCPPASWRASAGAAAASSTRRSSAGRRARRSPCPGARVHRHTTTGLLQDGLHRRQAETRAPIIGLGREERLEGPPPHVLRHANAVIAYREAQVCARHVGRQRLCRR